MTPLKSWFERLLSDERRQDKRQTALPLVAYYWDGNAPAPRRVRDISSTGMYLLTEQRWYPNTLVKVTLTRSDKPDTDPDRSIQVTGRVIRSEADGVGLAFLLSSSGKSRDLLGSEPLDADKKTVVKFLARLQADTKHGVVKFVSLIPMMLRCIINVVSSEGPAFGWIVAAGRRAVAPMRQI
jgi:hypothetical protein